MRKIKKWVNNFFSVKSKSNKFFDMIPKEVTPLDLRFMDIEKPD